MSLNQYEYHVFYQCSPLIKAPSIFVTKLLLNDKKPHQLSTRSKHSLYIYNPDNKFDGETNQKLLFVFTLFICFCIRILETLYFLAIFILQIAPLKIAAPF